MTFLAGAAGIQVFNIRQRHGIGFASEADRITRRAGTRRTSDAMYVIFRILWQVIVDDALNIRNMQAARGNIGADENLQVTALEVQ
jgi:hypothetical protein